MNTQTNTQTGFLESSRIALVNAKEQPEISAALKEHGYDEKTLQEGQELLDNAYAMLEKQEKEGKEEFMAYADFKKLITELESVYKVHRKKAKLLFKNNPSALKTLYLNGSLSRKYEELLKTIKNFYTELNTNNELQKKLEKLNVGKETISETLALATEVETTRASYIKEKGESQEATQQKNMALDALGDWMTNFNTIARIALEDTPQLLEALHKLVKS